MKTPITLITGYLGAGKTTLLRHIIASVQDRKFAILMNEFGAVAIDSKIIKGRNIDMVELKGGCVCCSLTGEFEAAIKEIKEKIGPELIIVETTGVAEPDAIVGDLSEIEGVRLDAVVTVVDADAMLRFPSLGYTGRVQIEMADVILLNKTDLVNETQLDKIEDTLRKINPEARIFRTDYCKIDTDIILDISAEKKISETAGKKGHRHHIGETGISHFVYASRKKLKKAALEDLLSSMPKDVVRVKGFVITDEGPLLVNFVFGRYDFEKFPAKGNQLVFIGKNIEKHKGKILKEIKNVR